MENNLQSQIESAIEDAVNQPVEASTTSLYESIEDYQNQTGKRFRMLKTEVQAGLTREEAFRQRFQS